MQILGFTFSLSQTNHLGRNHVIGLMIGVSPAMRKGCGKTVVVQFAFALKGRGW
jgi:hypothetical protein